ncbi:hypothetical protein, partial [Mesorhizobium sp. M7A.F.Ca.CA.002.04.1.1]|uniref:hypothetical protein n=1 Tax=Mesorhizobium sp. M7A.F.Ca.CA.002.04.1.1 TaxID=2496681 RepID=UPI0019D4196D
YRTGAERRDPSSGIAAHIELVLPFFGFKRPAQKFLYSTRKSAKTLLWRGYFRNPRASRGVV